MEDSHAANILQVEERNDVVEEEIVQRPDIEAEILRNIDEEDLRLLDAQPSILNPITHGLENIHSTGDSNRVVEEGELMEIDVNKLKWEDEISFMILQLLAHYFLMLVLTEPNLDHNNSLVMIVTSARYLPIILKEDK